MSASPDPPLASNSPASCASSDTSAPASTAPSASPSLPPVRIAIDSADAPSAPAATMSAAAHAAALVCIASSASDDSLSTTTGSLDAALSHLEPSACPSPMASDNSGALIMGLSQVSLASPSSRAVVEEKKDRKPSRRSRSVVPEVMDDSKLLMYKTETCHRERLPNQPCCYGNNCDFAHSQSEQRRNLKNQHYNPAMCRYIASGEECPEKERCLFCHNIVELYFHPLNYKRFPCPVLGNGKRCSRKCPCPFNHSTIVQPSASAPTIASATAGPAPSAVPTLLPSPSHPQMVSTFFSAPPNQPGAPTFMYPSTVTVSQNVPVAMPQSFGPQPVPMFAVHSSSMVHSPLHSPVAFVHQSFPQPYASPYATTFPATGQYSMEGPSAMTQPGQFVGPLPVIPQQSQADTEAFYHSRSLPGSGRRFNDDTSRFRGVASGSGSAIMSPQAISNVSTPRSATSSIPGFMVATRGVSSQSRRSSIPNLMSPTKSLKADETPLSDASPGSASTQASIAYGEKAQADVTLQILMNKLNVLTADSKATLDLYNERQRVLEENKLLQSRLSEALQKQASAEKSLALTHSMMQQVGWTADEDLRLLLGDTDALDTISQTALFRLAEINVSVGQVLERCKLRRATESGVPRTSCMMCNSANIDCVLVPCKHQSACHTCARTHLRCPLCNSSVTGSMGLKDERVAAYQQRMLAFQASQATTQ